MPYGEGLTNPESCGVNGNVIVEALTSGSAEPHNKHLGADVLQEYRRQHLMDR